MLHPHELMVTVFFPIFRGTSRSCIRVGRKRERAAIIKMQRRSRRRGGINRRQNGGPGVAKDRELSCSRKARGSRNCRVITCQITLKQYRGSVGAACRDGEAYFIAAVSPETAERHFKGAKKA